MIKYKEKEILKKKKTKAFLALIISEGEEVLLTTLSFLSLFFSFFWS